MPPSWSETAPIGQTSERELLMDFDNAKLLLEMP
jgi:hypothetical protein